MKVAPDGGKVKYSTIVFPDKEKEKEKSSDKKSREDTSSSSSTGSSTSSSDRRSSNSGRGLIKGSTLAQKTAAITKTLSGLTSKLTLSSSHSSSSHDKSPPQTSTATAAAVAAISALSAPPNRPPPMPDLSDVSKIRPQPLGEESEPKEVVTGIKSSGSITGNGGRSHAKLERKESYKNVKQERKQTHQQQNTKTPPASPPRRRALSTPTRSRKFPSEAELADAIKAHQERRESPPSKTRTLPARDKLWMEDDFEAEEGFWDYEDAMSEGYWVSNEAHHDESSSEDLQGLTRSAPATELGQAMQAMRLKVRRKSSTGDAYDNVFEPECSPTGTKQHFVFGGGDSGSGSGTESPRCETSSPSKSTSPVSRRLHRSELEQAFARRKLTGRFHNESFDFDNHSSGSNSPTCFDDQCSSGYRPVPAVPMNRSRDYCGSPDSPSYMDHEYRGSISTRKPVPLPRNQRCRESTSEHISSFDSGCPTRPVPSPPHHFNLSFDFLSGARDSSGDETYMNVAFKPKTDNHRYENVVLDDRLSQFHSERPLSSSDSPRISTELRPVPAPRFYSSPSSSSHSLSSLDSNNQLASPCTKQSSQATCNPSSSLSASSQSPTGRGSPNHHHRGPQLSPKHGSHGNGSSSAASASHCCQGGAVEKPPRTNVGGCSQDRSSNGSHVALSRNASSHPGHYNRDSSSSTTKLDNRKEVRAMSNGHASKELRNSSISQDRSSGSPQQVKESRSSHHSPLVQSNSIGMEGCSMSGAQGGTGGSNASGTGSYSKATGRALRSSPSKDQPLPTHGKPLNVKGV
ncbi:uncharacterized protein LOC129254363 [Lytechinus pictus]|uniref:uncharacterized protein LOC129254363 n=1 Tax=Lytechinus pictus TaxID=7653 RepID=UPI0030BA07C5